MHSIKLLYNDNDGNRREIVLSETRRDEWSVGRQGQAIVLDHDSVSRKHARVFWQIGQWMVEDLGSRNGTFVNQQRISSASAISGGDRLRFGRVPVEVQTAEASDDGVKPLEVLQIAYDARKAELKKLTRKLDSMHAQRAELEEEMSFLRHENEMLTEQLQQQGGLQQWKEPVDSMQTLQGELPPLEQGHLVSSTQQNMSLPKATGELDVHAKLDRMMDLLQRMLAGR